MSELEDDVLMEYIKQGKLLLEVKAKLEATKERTILLDNVWLHLHYMVKEMLLNPSLYKPMEQHLLNLRNSVEAVLTYDARHAAPPDERD